MKNHHTSLTHLFGDSQKAPSPEFNAQSDGLVIATPGHMVQFYEDEAFLNSTLREFVGTGLHAGHACVVIGTRQHIRELEGQLADAINQSVATGRGWYIAVDVTGILRQITQDGTPDRRRFMQAAGGIIAKAGKHGTLVRVFSEMVTVLDREGKTEEVLAVEQFWDELAGGRTHVPEAARARGGTTDGYVSALRSRLVRQKQTEEALRLSEMRYRRLFETAVDGILLIDASTHAIIDANPSAAQLLGYSKNRLTGTNIFTLRPFSVNEHAKDEFTRLTADQRLRYEATLEAETGVCNEIEIIATPYTEGLAPIIQLSLRDITERKKAERLEMRTSGLLAEREHLMELNVAKDEFISIASHQLRTPATGVKQYIGMLLQGFMGDISEMQRIGLRKAYESNERQLKIVNDLLLVARVDAGKIELSKAPCDVVQLIRDVASEQQDEIARRRQTIQLRLPRSLTISIDARFIRMVLENLVTNASKYSDDGLPIKITARRAGGTVRISVRDRGVGIRKRDLPKLYQKFSRIYNDRSTVVDGTGLGLYWSKKIIELHNGALSVKSKVNQGSTFTLTLPAA